MRNNEFKMMQVVLVSFVLPVPWMESKAILKYSFLVFVCSMVKM